MIFCRMSFGDGLVFLGEGLNPTEALNQARDKASEYYEPPENAVITFWEGTKMSLRVEWEPRILGPED